MIRALRIIAAVAMVAVAIGGWWYVRQAPHREVESKLDMAFGFIDLDRDDFRIPDGSSDKNVTCNDGDPKTRYGRQAYGRGPVFNPEDRSQIAEQMASAFEAQGWTVQRSIPAATPMSTAYYVEAINGRDRIIATFSTAGTVNVGVRIDGCPFFVDDPSRIEVDEFPVDP